MAEMVLQFHTKQTKLRAVESSPLLAGPPGVCRNTVLFYSRPNR